MKLTSDILLMFSIQAMFGLGQSGQTVFGSIYRLSMPRTQWLLVYVLPPAVI